MFCVDPENTPGRPERTPFKICLENQQRCFRFPAGACLLRLCNLLRRVTTAACVHPCAICAPKTRQKARKRTLRTSMKHRMSDCFTRMSDRCTRVNDRRTRISDRLSRMSDRLTALFHAAKFSRFDPECRNFGASRTWSAVHLRSKKNNCSVSIPNCSQLPP